MFVHTIATASHPAFSTEPIISAMVCSLTSANEKLSRRPLCRSAEQIMPADFQFAMIFA